MLAPVPHTRLGHSHTEAIFIMAFQARPKANHLKIKVTSGLLPTCASRAWNFRNLGAARQGARLAAALGLLRWRGTSLSQRSLHIAPIFRLLLKVAVNGTQQCDFLNFCGSFGPNYRACLVVGETLWCAMRLALGLEALIPIWALAHLARQGRSPLTTVLAQDHFYSDFLSLHVSVKTNNKAMMMLALPCMGKDASGHAACRLEDQPSRSKEVN